MPKSSLRIVFWWASSSEKLPVSLRSGSGVIADRYLTHAQNSLRETPVDVVGVVKYPIMSSIAGKFISHVATPR